jgi:putative tricarboxylic transport membrane protein
MLERAVSLLWILLGAGAALQAAKLGIIGPSGPESGLFPLIAATIIGFAGVILLVQAKPAAGPVFPRGAALGRVLGVIAGLALMAAAIPYVGFAVAGALTMIVLLRSVEMSWTGSVALAVVSVAAVVWLFGHVLGMALPRGPWGW